MRPKRVALAAVATKVVPVSQYDAGYRVQVGGTFVGTYSVEFTDVDIHKLGIAEAEWKSETDQTTQTAASELFYNGGITAFRLNVTIYTSGSIEMNITSVPY